MSYKPRVGPGKDTKCWCGSGKKAKNCHGLTAGEYARETRIQGRVARPLISLAQSPSWVPHSSRPLRRVGATPHAAPVLKLHNYQITQLQNAPLLDQCAPVAAVRLRIGCDHHGCRYAVARFHVEQADALGVAARLADRR